MKACGFVFVKHADGTNTIDTASTRTLSATLVFWQSRTLELFALARTRRAEYENLGDKKKVGEQGKKIPDVTYLTDGGVLL